VWRKTQFSSGFSCMKPDGSVDLKTIDDYFEGFYDECSQLGE